MAAPKPAKALSEALSRKTTLYLSSRTGEVGVRGKCVVIKGEERECAFRLEKIRRIVLLGAAKLDGDLLRLCMLRQIPVDWLDPSGNPLGQLLAFGAGPASMALKQAAFRNSQEALILAKLILLVKLENCHWIIRRRGATPLPLRARDLALIHAADEESLRGCEGIAAKMYFELWPNLVKPFVWEGRKPHPAPDPVNMLLSLGYTLVHNRLVSALRAAGLDPLLGFFHHERGRHCALASDLMEPFRASVDTTVLTLIRRKELHPDDFKIKGDRCVCADKRLFGRLLRCFEDMFAKTYRFHPIPQEPERNVERTLNDAIEDLAQSYASHLKNGAAIFLPRLHA